MAGRIIAFCVLLVSVVISRESSYEHFDRLRKNMCEKPQERFINFSHLVDKEELEKIENQFGAKVIHQSVSKSL